MANRGTKNIFTETPNFLHRTHEMREFAQKFSTSTGNERERIYFKTFVRHVAKRCTSSSLFVSAAHTRSAFSNSEYSSPSAKPKTIFSYARRSTKSCAGRGNRNAAS